MAAIRPCTGTTAMWQAVKDTLILKEREIGVEIDTGGHALIRQGDGVNKFFDLQNKLLDGLEKVENYADGRKGSEL